GGGYALAFDAQGNLYASNAGTAAGTTVYKIPAAGALSSYASGFSDARGVAVDALSKLHVPGFGANTRRKIRRPGEIGRSTSTFAPGQSGPVGEAFDSSGNLYVSNFFAATVSKVTPQGVVSTFASSGLSGPRGLAFDSSGNLYVANGNSPAGVSKFTSAGAL